MEIESVSFQISTKLDKWCQSYEENKKLHIFNLIFTVDFTLWSATKGLPDAQVHQDWARAGTHVDLDGVGHVQGVPSYGTNNPCLVNATQ